MQSRSGTHRLPHKQQKSTAEHQRFKINPHQTIVLTPALQTENCYTDNTHSFVYTRIIQLHIHYSPSPRHHNASIVHTHAHTHINTCLPVRLLIRPRIQARVPLPTVPSIRPSACPLLLPPIHPLTQPSAYPPLRRPSSDNYKSSSRRRHQTEK